MITLDNGVLLVQDPSELPDLTGAAEKFIDVETVKVFDVTKFDVKDEDSDYDDNDAAVSKKHGGMYPFKGDRICGVAVTVDDDPRCWYVPARHTDERWNIPLENYQRWFRALIGSKGDWINHNVVFDALFAHFDGAEFGGRLIDTLSLAKIHDTDRMSYGLKPLCREWCDLEMSEALDIDRYLEHVKSKNYADVPADIMGRYAGQDTRGNRVLYRYLQKRRHPQVAKIWDKEIALSAGLYDMELQGLMVNRAELQKDRFTGLQKLINLSTQISMRTGREFTNSNQCLQDLLLNQYNMPVLMTKWEKHKVTGRLYDTGRPTFNKKAMALYEIHPMTLADPELKELMGWIMKYRKESQHQSLFVEPFLGLMDDLGYVHPRYNPIVRTGRMSCSRPNAQQQNKRSKALIHPRPGYGFISCDYSQIEFRLIIHYIEDVDAIRAYNENPNTDFHEWVAKMIGIKRKPAKTMNFCIGYGAGKRKVEGELAANPDIIEDVSHQINQLIDAGEVKADRRHEVFQELCQKRAAEVYNKYHSTFPGIKRESEAAAAACRMRGYVANAYGRQRHLPVKVAHKAFNSVVQGCAMDLIKERMNTLFPRYNSWMRERGISIAANVHDEVLFEVPIPLLNDPEVHRYLLDALQNPSIPFRIPITCGLGISTQHWAEAAGDDTVVDSEGRKIAGKLF